jgi:hypothetical protein
MVEKGPVASATGLSARLKFHKGRQLPACPALATGNRPRQVQPALTCFAGGAYVSVGRFDGKRMSQLDAAMARLDAALEKLESIAEFNQNRTRPASRAAEWTKERETLLARIAALEEEVRAISSVNEEIETRLDSAMGEIRIALGH